MCYSSGTGDFSSRRRLDQTAADPESSVATPTGRRVLKRFITAEVRRSSLQAVAGGVNKSGDGSSGGKVGHKRQVIEEVMLRGKLEGEQATPSLAERGRI